MAISHEWNGSTAMKVDCRRVKYVTLLIIDSKLICCAIVFGTEYILHRVRRVNSLYNQLPVTCNALQNDKIATV